MFDSAPESIKKSIEQKRDEVEIFLKNLAEKKL